MVIPVILCGFGNVGKALAGLLDDRAELVQKKYGFSIRCQSIIVSTGAVVSPDGIPLRDIVAFAGRGHRIDTHEAFGRSGFGLKDVLAGAGCDADVPGAVFECTPTDTTTGGVGLEHFRLAIERGRHVVSANKGPLVVRMPELLAAAQKKGVQVKFSGATAAALPTADVGMTCLAGSTVQRIEGIVTGTANLLLTRMAETGKPFDEALSEAQKIGMAETDPRLDTEGWDTASKIVILANALMECRLKLSDVEIEGITGLDPGYVRRTKSAGREIKLMGVVECIGGRVTASVKPTEIDNTHPLFGVNGTDKGITFTTDTMGTVTVTGGKAGPSGTAAALLKDLINIYTR